jgi:hypothetical protein
MTGLTPVRRGAGGVVRHEPQGVDGLPDPLPGAVGQLSRLVEATRAKVEATMAELRFVRNETARHLRVGHSRVWAYVMLDGRNPFFTDVAGGGVEDVADEADRPLFLCHSANLAAREAACLRRPEQQQVQGILITPVDPGSPHLDEIARRGHAAGGRRPDAGLGHPLLRGRRSRGRRPVRRSRQHRPQHTFLVGNSQSSVLTSPNRHGLLAVASMEPVPRPPPGPLQHLGLVDAPLLQTSPPSIHSRGVTKLQW